MKDMKTIAVRIPGPLGKKIDAACEKLKMRPSDFLRHVLSHTFQDEEEIVLALLERRETLDITRKNLERTIKELEKTIQMQEKLLATERTYQAAMREEYLKSKGMSAAYRLGKIQQDNIGATGDPGQIDLVMLKRT